MPARSRDRAAATIEANRFVTEGTNHPDGTGGETHRRRTEK